MIKILKIGTKAVATCEALCGMPTVQSGGNYRARQTSCICSILING